MRVLVTGISGFVGRHLSAELSGEAWEVFGTYYPEEESATASKMDASHRELCDIRDKKKVSVLVKKIHPEAIVHLAAITFVPHSIENPILAAEVNLMGTINLYEAILESRIAPTILFIGSAEEYGQVSEKELPITENQPLNPQNPYACSKAAADLMSHQYYLYRALRIIRVRPFSHIGPGQSEYFVTSDFARQIALIEKGKCAPFIHVGNLSACRDFTDVRDVVRAYRLLLEQGKPGEVYNVARGVEYSIEEVLDKLLAMSKKRVEIKVDKRKLRATDVKHFFGSSENLTSRTGWRARIDLEKSLEDILNCWRNRV